MEKREPIIKKVVTAVAEAWNDVGRAFLGPCGGQEEPIKPVLAEKPEERKISK